MKKRSWLKTIILFLVVFIAANLWSTRNHLAGAAPSFVVADLTGEQHLFEFTGSGKPILLHFFATWCPICELENESLISINEDHQLIVIAMQSGEVDEIKAYAKKHNLTMPIYNDASGEISSLYKVTGVPTSFIINPQGQISSSTMGYASELGLRFRLWLSQL